MNAVSTALRKITAPFRRVEPPLALDDFNLCAAIHPTEFHDARGGRLTGRDGREYVDVLSAWGANILGYGHPRVARAIADQAARFAGAGMPFAEFWKLADRLREIIPCAEAVRYGKNGSDATLGAVRLARAVTQREHVLHRGYHGFHDWWQASIECPGVPAVLQEKITALTELTPESVAAALHTRRGEVACLIIDPMVPPAPTTEDMTEIARIVRDEDALLIFDEIVSGFRLAPGGMQAVWGVAPDLACFGKAIANGMPLSVIAGSERLIRRLSEVHYGMTFEGEAVSIAAALATIEVILEENVCARLAQKGRRLKEACARLADAAGVTLRLVGPDARPMIEVHDQNGLSARALRWLVLQELASRDVLSVGTINLCHAHDERDLTLVENAFAAAIQTMAGAIRRGSIRGLLNQRIIEALGED